MQNIQRCQHLNKATSHKVKAKHTRPRLKCQGQESQGQGQTHQAKATVSRPRLSFLSVYCNRHQLPRGL